MTSRDDGIDALRVEIADLRATVGTLSDAIYTAQGAVLQLMHAAEARHDITSVEALLGYHGGYLHDPRGLTTRPATEEALRQRIRRAKLYQPAPTEES